MSILIFGMSPGSVYIANRFKRDGYDIHHIHSHDGKYSKIDVFNELCGCILKNDYDFVFPIIFKNQKSAKLQYVIKYKNCNALLPSMEASKLESDKLHAKQFLQNLGIPTAKVLDEPPVGKLYVIKSNIDQNGLQTRITTNGTENNCFIEEYLEGPEYSYHAVLNRKGWNYLGSARDYKTVFDGDEGHNTIGMGSYSLKDRIDMIVHSYMDKIFNALKSMGIDYVGVMYLGIKVVDGIPYVLEINTRIGDPEIQSIGETVDNFSEMLFATGTNQDIPNAIFSSCEAVTIKLMNKKYGSSEYQEPKDLFGDEGVTLCKPEDITLTYGTLHATGETVEKAANKIYSYLKNRDLGSYRYRTDIGLLK